MNLIRPLKHGDKIKLKNFMEMIAMDDSENDFGVDDELLDNLNEWVTIMAISTEENTIEYAVLELVSMIPHGIINIEATNSWLESND